MKYLIKIEDVTNGQLRDMHGDIEGDDNISMVIAPIVEIEVHELDNVSITALNIYLRANNIPFTIGE